MVSIHNKVVYGGPALSIPGHLNFGQFLLDEFRRICETEADRVALINGETGEETTYKKLFQEFVNIGSGLKKLGVKRGDVVALCCENRIEYLAAALGALTCGACITPLNTQYTKGNMSCLIYYYFSLVYLHSSLKQLGVERGDVVAPPRCAAITASSTGGGDGRAHLRRLHHAVYQRYIHSGLKKLGVERGDDVVTLCCKNPIVYLAAAPGALTCGACITSFNTQYTKDEMIHVLNISTPNILICTEAVAKDKYATFKSLPFIKTVVQLDGTPINRDVLMYKDLITPTDVQNYEAGDVQGWTDCAYLLYSSGTTGLPKGVMLTHINVLYSVANFNREDTAIEDVTLLTVVPWYHAYGLISTVSYLLVKKKLVYLSGFNPHVYLSSIEKYKVNVLVAVPPIVVFLGKSPLVLKYDMSSVFAVLCGAAPLTSETINDAMKRLPGCIGIFQGYGMTETTLAATLDLDLEKTKPGSAGYPIKGVKVKVVDLETGERLGSNQSGEVCLKGPVTMKGYAGNEAATRDMLDSEGYLRTGDIGYYDDDGCFFVIDRLKELIKYKGSQVPPAEVESVLLEHPGVAECAVVGAPDEVAGELPTAFVVPKHNANLTQRDIIDFVAARLSAAKRLHGGVIFINAIPKNPSGKILRRILRQQLKQNKKSKL